MSAEEKEKLTKAKAIKWWKKINYGGGRQGLFWSTELHNPAFLIGFSANDIEVIKAFVFIAWKFVDWEVEASITFLEAGLEHRKISGPTITRSIHRWMKAGYLKRTARSYTPGIGSRYLVSSEFMQKSERDKLAHHELSAILVVKAKAKQEKRKAEAEAERKRLAAEKHKKQKAWAEAVTTARAAGNPEPSPESYMTDALN